MGNLVCGNPPETVVSLEESYIAQKQAGLQIHFLTGIEIMNAFKKYGHHGVLTPFQYFQSLVDLGLLSSEENLELSYRRVQNYIKWQGFYSLFEQKDKNNAKYYDIVTLIVGFLLLTNDLKHEKIVNLYDTLDFRLKGYLTQKQVKSIMTTFCLVSSCYLPFYSNDYPFPDRIKFNSLLLSWRSYYKEVAISLTKKILFTEQFILKKDFVFRSNDIEFGDIFNAVTLRSYVSEQSKTAQIFADSALSNDMSARVTLPNINNQNQTFQIPYEKFYTQMAIPTISQASNWGGIWDRNGANTPPARRDFNKISFHSYYNTAIGKRVQKSSSAFPSPRMENYTFNTSFKHEKKLIGRNSYQV